ncbi:ABC transporter substrate-binding protein [Sphaerothrix gracilis]|uniref:ABC transporter substrate-binding protein n=1 Tax=Sphaerothrix gracilis TaxID=3151835 RepID=UPI0031FD1862
MSNRNETPVLLISLLITVALVGALGAWLWPRLQLGGSDPSTDSAQSVNTQTETATETSDSRLSQGEQILVADASPLKQQGVEAIAAGNYDQAVSLLESALAENRNDPEALIYLNNARIAEQQAYTIAVAAPVETALDPALEILRGVAQAQTEINQAGGLDGVPLRVVIADDGNSPAEAEAIANQLVAAADVLAVVGHFSSNITLATAPIYTEGQLPLISPTSTSVEISGVSDYVFRTTPSDRFAATTLARYMLNQLSQQTAAVFFNSESDYSTSLKNEFTTAVFSDGGQIAAELDLAAPNFNAAEAVQQLKSQGVETLMLAANTSTLDQAIAVIEANGGDLAMLGGDSLYNPEVLSVGAAADDLVVAIPWHILADPEADFAQDSRRLWGGDVSWRTAMAYDAVMAIAAALESTPVTNRQNLQATLTSATFAADGAASQVKFLPSGDRNQAAQLVTVEPGSRSGRGYDFVPVTP